MDVHEYQARNVLKKFGIPIPEYAVASNLEEAKQAIQDLGLTSGVVKIQVHAGGRGKAGGVKLGKTPEELMTHAENLIGMKIVNNQTGPAGIIANQVLITSAADITKEYYVGAVMDRETASAKLIVSPEGGVNIEEIAEKTPEKIMTVPIRLDGTLKRFQLLNLTKFMGWEGDLAKQGAKVLANLAKAFIETDASLLEINPLIKTTDDQILAIDAKLGVDDNALFRQKEIAEYFDPTQVSSNEARAKEIDLAYISLDGEIGCMVNGAGLAMATMDIIHHYGFKPANFLDVGGSATKEKVTEGFKIIISDPKVKAILVNIFGGIMNCVTIAAGVIAAVGELDLKVPLVVRLEGTNVEKGKLMIQDSGLNIITAESMTDAAEKIVEAVKNNGGQ